MRILLLAATLLAFEMPAQAQSPAAAQPPTDIKSVDWGNRSYGRHMRLRNGRYAFRRYPRRGSAVAKRCRHTSQTARLIKVHYGDLNGDGKIDALVELSKYTDYCVGRGSTRRVLVAFEMSPTGPVELARLAPANVSAVGLDKTMVHVQRRDAQNGKWVACKEAWRLGKAKFLLAQSKCKPAP